MESKARDAARLVAIEDQEAGEPEGWVWLTFREEDGRAVAAAIVRGRGVVSAMRAAERLAIAARPHVSATKLPLSGMPSPGAVNRLMTIAEAHPLALLWTIPLSPDAWPAR